MGTALAGELPAWRVAQLDDSSLAGFGPPAEDADRTWRVAEEDRTAVLTLPAWWGQSFRPSEGTVYDIRITYKDTASQPIVLLSHGGIGRGWGLSEIHRFGGRGDGQWKTALVPLSWDLVCRINEPFRGPTDATQLAIQANKDLPVEKIEVLPAAPDAAVRFARQTREWVGRVQADVRRQADLGGVQKPAVPDSMRNRALIPFVRPHLLPVMTVSAPQSGETGVPLVMRMARNEYESAGFGLYANLRTCKQVVVTVGRLRDVTGNTLEADVEVRQAEYAVVHIPSGQKEQGYKFLPQRLWPADRVDLEKGQSQWYVLTVRTRGTASKPGRYKTTLRFQANGVTAELPLEVEVLPVTLLTVQQAGIDCGSCTIGLPPTQDLAALASYNYTGMDLWYFTTAPQMRVVDGRLQMDWAYLDDWMKYAKRHGMDHMMWFLGADPNGFPDTLQLERSLYASRGTGAPEQEALRKEFLAKATIAPAKVLPEIRDLYAEWVQQLAEHAGRAGWPRRFLLHPYDEPAKWSIRQKRSPEILGTGLWIRDHFEDCCELIRKGAKGRDNILVAGEMYTSEPSMVFLDDVDIFCSGCIREDLQQGEKVRKAGRVFWQYAGGNAYLPAHHTRYTYGFFFATFDARGSLTWAYNWYDGFDMSRQAEQWGYGWYTPFGNVPAPSLIGMREGLDDRRWIETCKALKNPQVDKVLQEIFQEVRPPRNIEGWDAINLFWAEPYDYRKLDGWRSRVIDALLATQSPPSPAARQRPR
jgi:hypothetical protein